MSVENRFAFSQVGIDPKVRRSRFKRPTFHKFTGNAGWLIPCYRSEYLPGDTININFSVICRSQTPFHATMDQAYLDVHFFAVPYRLVWSNFKEFMGEAVGSKWTPSVERIIPQIQAPASGGFAIGTAADYFGITPGVASMNVSALPLRAYALIWNEYWRDQNLQDPVEIPMDDSTVVGANSGDHVINGAKGMILTSNRFHDYFSSALPFRNRGDELNLEMELQPDGPLTVSQTISSSGQILTSPLEAGSVVSGGNPILAGSGGFSSGNFITYDSGIKLALNSDGMNNFIQAYNINQFLTISARTGGRYRELIRGHFGVTPSDRSMQVPEYLGGKRIPLNITQVPQTSSSSENSPQGNIAGYSLTGEVCDVCTKSFDEHGIIIGVCTVRANHSYQQGVERFFLRQNRFDFFWRELEQSPDQPIFGEELYAFNSYGSRKIFGYQEAYADYKYEPSRISGEFRSGHANSLDSWHYADEYSSVPTLGSDWIQETPDYIDRTLAVQSETAHQFLFDFKFDNTWVRPMSMYTMPGLFNHN